MRSDNKAGEDVADDERLFQHMHERGNGCGDDENQTEFGKNIHKKLIKLESYKTAFKLFVL